MSPHLEIWRWHLTMAGSILHRITGVGSIVGLILVVLWLTSAALGREAYTGFITLAASPFGLFVWFGLTLVLMVHLTGGLRHLIWDSGAAFEPKTADLLTGVSLIVSVVLTILFWVALFATGKVSL